MSTRRMFRAGQLCVAKKNEMSSPARTMSTSLYAWRVEGHRSLINKVMMMIMMLIERVRATNDLR